MKDDYRVKVVETHVDYVWVKAESAEQAELIAPGYACCEFEVVDYCEVVEGPNDDR